MKNKPFTFMQRVHESHVKGTEAKEDEHVFGCYLKNGMQYFPDIICVMNGGACKEITMPLKADDIHKLREALGNNKTMIEIADVAETLAQYIRDGTVRAAVILVEFKDGGKKHYAAVDEREAPFLLGSDQGGGGPPAS